jgi:hypothetical protein
MGGKEFVRREQLKKVTAQNRNEELRILLKLFNKSRV